jgi:TetR/AcrR family transcriptional repressor of mexJK operon
VTKSEETRSGRKRAAIFEAATAAFLTKGYQGTSLDEIAAEAAVSKQTVYKHFADKERLFTEIVLATTDRVDELVRVTAGTLAHTTDLERDLGALARRFLTTLMQRELIQLRKLVIANADRFPDVSRAWFERGFERVLATLTSAFERLAEAGELELEDPFLAANHFVGLLLWIPVNRATFCGLDDTADADELDNYADAAVRAFLRAYGVSPPNSA